jgi:ankyrin repeat protein
MQKLLAIINRAHMAKTNVEEKEKLLNEAKEILRQELGPDLHVATKHLDIIFTKDWNKIDVGNISPEAEAIRGQYEKKFIESTYRELLAYTRLAYCFEKNGIADEHAIKLATMFGTTQDALKYLGNMMQKHQKSQYPLHDACLFTLPPAKCKFFKDWVVQAKKIEFISNPKFRNIFPNALEIEGLLSGKKYSPVVSAEQKQLEQEMSNANKRLKEVNSDVNRADNKERDTLKQEIAEIQVKLSTQYYCNTPINMSTAQHLLAHFERYKQESSEHYKYFIDHGLTAANYGKFLSLDRSNAGVNLPDIIIDGVTIGYPGIYIKKVDVKDTDEAIRAACFGKLTGCCQSLSGEAGEPCAIHGLTDPNGGFYVVCKGDAANPKATDELVAQSWTWRSVSGGLVFDSVEVADKDNEESKKMVANLYRDLSEQMFTRHKISSVGIGVGSGIEGVGISVLTRNNFEQPIGYSLYRDSKNIQSVIISQEIPYILKNEEDLKQIFFLPNMNKEPDAVEFIQMLNISIQFYLKPILTAYVNLGGDYANFYDTAVKLKSSINGYDSNATESEINELAQDLEDNHALDHILTDEGNSILMLAIAQGYTDLACKLIDKNMDLNKLNNNNDCAIMLAIYKNNMDITFKLIDNKVDLNVESTWDGSHVLMYAVGCNATDIFFKLLDNRVELNLDINEVNCAGDNALMMASINNNVDIAFKLIDNHKDFNIDLNHVNKSGDTALMIALQNDDPAIVLKLLTDENVDINVVNIYGDTALSLAMQRIREEIALQLLDDTRLSIDLNAADSSGNSLLIAALNSGFKDVPVKLLEKNVDINVVNNGDTALSSAMQCGNPEIALQLLDDLRLSIDLNAADSSGNYLLLMALNSGYRDIAVKLLERNVDINVVNNNGDTALSIAIRNEYQDIVQLLERKQNSTNEQMMMFSEKKTKPSLQSLARPKNDKGSPSNTQNVEKKDRP